MQNQSGCQRCLNARDFNATGQERYEQFLICNDGHSACKECYDKLKNHPCPFDGRQFLRVEKPIKALQIKQEASAIANCAEEYERLYKQNQRIKRQIQEVKNAGGVDPEPGRLPIVDPARLMRQQLEKLKKELNKWEDRTAHRHLALFLLMDITMALVLLTSTVLQIYILAWSVETDYYEVTSIVFYFVIFFLIILIIYYKKVLSFDLFSDPSPKSALEGFFGLLCTYFFYFAILSDIARKRIAKYTKHRNDFKPRRTFTFEYVNYSFFCFKVLIFLQEFLRLFDMASSKLNQAVLTFSCLELTVLLLSDLIYYRMVKNQT